jgi:hypothetical protein
VAVHGERVRAVRAAVCGSTHGSVRAVRAAVYGSARGSVCAVRLVVHGSARGSVWLFGSVAECRSAAVCGSVR